jgi:hypothetical protein
MPLSTETTEDSLQVADRLMEAEGFDIHQVTWGYQEIFREAIAELIAAGLLGGGNRTVTRRFFELLSRSDKSGFDMVLKSCLSALRGPYRWIMHLPKLFERWSNTGLNLAEQTYFLGSRFFEYSGKGKLGKTPTELEFFLDMISYLQAHQPELVGPLMEGFEWLSEKLDDDTLREFVFHAINMYRRNPGSAKSFLAGELRTSQIYVDRMSSEATLSNCTDSLKRLAQALTGENIEINNLGGLDSDDLLERGSTVVACSNSFYFPEKLSAFGSRAENYATYKTITTLAANALNLKGFATVHGTEGMRTCEVLFNEHQQKTAIALPVFYLAETVRIIESSKERFPGLVPNIQKLVDLEFEIHPPGQAFDILLATLLGFQMDHLMEDGWKIVDLIRGVAEQSSSFRQTLELVLKDLDRIEGHLPKDMHSMRPRPLSFFPDPLFPMSFSPPPGGEVKADLHEAHETPPTETTEDEKEKTDTAEEKRRQTQNYGSEEDSPDETHDAGGGAGYYYDEWDVHCHDYRRDWCCLHEIRPDSGDRKFTLSESAKKHAEQVRRLFEKIKPEEAREETRLLEGDTIHMDHLVEYMSQGDERHKSEGRFYNKPFMNTRDLAVAILLDVSGSTGEESEKEQKQQHTVLQVEKEAAFVLATGLYELGDAFAIYGFTGNGRQNCLFHIYKDFEDKWGDDSLRSLMRAVPGSATRIGPALRHAGWKLGQRGENTKLMLLVTDGKPCDQEYDTESKYAQQDVHQAVMENREQGINTFCISTSENPREDMELMFPGGRYLILEDIDKLPSALSHLYLKLTR